jgi:hypothetical protein
VNGNVERKQHLIVMQDFDSVLCAQDTEGSNRFSGHIECHEYFEHEWTPAPSRSRLSSGRCDLFYRFDERRSNIEKINTARCKAAPLTRLSSIRLLRLGCWAAYFNLTDTGGGASQGRPKIYCQCIRSSTPEKIGACGTSALCGDSNPPAGSSPRVRPRTIAEFRI